jgi:predicted nucleic-acid-binding Zn-ribbon protein
MTIEYGWRDSPDPFERPKPTKEMLEEKNCPKCKVEMVIGQVIYPYELKNRLYDPSVPIANKDNLRLVKCWKCPSCGNSEELLVYKE